MMYQHLTRLSSRGRSLLGRALGRPTKRTRRRLRFESLESRRVFAQGLLVTQTFREDDFSVSGSFTYRLHSPENSDYTDVVDNGRYVSSSGHIKWTSPTQGTGFFEGTASGDGQDTVQFAGLRTCSQYGFEETGRLDFTIDAASSALRFDRADTSSNRYTYYRDMTGGQCPQPNPPWTRFFGGTISSYTGTFTPGNHQVNVQYASSSPDLTVNAPATDIRWTNTAATDLALKATSIASTATVPAGYEAIQQSTNPPAAVDFVDIKNGGIEVTVDVTGQLPRTTTPATPVATLRAYWASSLTDLTGTEIPITSSTNPLGVYWNHSQWKATIRQLPAAPQTAKFIRIAIDAPAAVDSVATNSTRFLPLGDFQAREATSDAVSEDTDLDGSSSSVLHPLDRSDGSIRVLGFKPESDLGAVVEVLDDLGSYIYAPTSSERIQALAEGQTINDVIRFVAIKDQILLDEATLTIPILGKNDAPNTEMDGAATTSFHVLNLLPATLLANDGDVDLADSIRIHAVDPASSLNAEVRLVWNAEHTAIEQIIYDPTKSSTLRALAVGAQTDDVLRYEVIDSHGATAIGSVNVTVTGEERVLSIAPLGPQLTRSGTPITALPVTVEDPDGDTSDVQLTVVAGDSTLVPTSGLEVTKLEGLFAINIQPAAGQTGRTTITVTARDTTGLSASTTFPLVVGAETDLDLDGVADEVEDAAPHDGDMNQDGLPDSQQSEVVSVLAKTGNRYLNFVVPDEQFLLHVTVTDAAFPAGPASGAEFPLGLVQFEVWTESPGATSLVTLRTEPTDSPLNRVFESTASGWSSLMFNKRDGARIFSDHYEINLRDGGRGDTNATADGRLVVSLALGNVAHPWQNVVREDVDNDGLIVPLDVLLLVNQINNFGSRSLGSMPAEGSVLTTFLDPSGNDSLEPIDVLIVVNFLNNRSAEGEFAAAAFDGPLPEIGLTNPQEVDHHHHLVESGTSRLTRSAMSQANLPVTDLTPKSGNGLAATGRSREGALSMLRSRPRTHFANDVELILAQEDFLVDSCFVKANNED